MKGEMDPSCTFIWFSSFQLGFILVGFFVGFFRSPDKLNLILCYLLFTSVLSLFCYNCYRTHGLNKDFLGKRTGQVNAIN